jgi:nucleotide-binding universal stress UspA family protein
MSSEQKVLACVDRSALAADVTDWAAWAARRLGAPLELLHVIDHHPETAIGDDRSGALGIDASEHLLDALAAADASRSKAAREAGRLFLNSLRVRAMASGVVSPDMRLRHGALAETLVDMEAGVGLFVLGRGASSAPDRSVDLERVVRALHEPILTVPGGFIEPSRVLIAFDGGTVTRRGVERVASSRLFAGLKVHLLMSSSARGDAASHLAWARAALESAGLETTSELADGDAESAVTAAIGAQHIDLLVMGAYGHSPLRSLLLGSRTSALLRSSRIPTLMLR